MSEDDRAAKAARAKALLQKRQQKKKAGGAASNASAASSFPSSPTLSARAFSPAPSELLTPAHEDEKDPLGDVFSNKPSDGGDAHWLSSLTRVDSSPVVALSRPPSNKGNHPSDTTKPHAKPISPTHHDDGPDLRALTQTQQQTISLLVSEKASLTASIEHLRDVESKAQEAESSLREELQKSRGLQERVRRLEDDSLASSSQLDQLLSKEKELTDKSRDQERELQLVHGTANDLRALVASQQNIIRDLEERLQNDDLVARLQSSLKNTQDRADELEFQLSKLKQAHATLKTERDNVEAQVREHNKTESVLRTEITGLQERHSALETRLSSTVTERDAASENVAALQSEVDLSRKAVVEMENKLSQAASELSSLARQLQNVQNELRSARRRAEEAESTQIDLQSESSNLMRSLEEMRPKLVELTNSKLELNEKAEILENELRSRDSVIERLEAALEHSRQTLEETDAQQRRMEADWRREHSASEETLVELRQAYGELQQELQTTREELQNLQSEHLGQQQTAADRGEQIARLTVSSQSKEEQLFSLQQELEESIRAQTEEQEFLERARSQIEKLRRDLAFKDEEIERLRETVSSAAPPSTNPHSLDEEMLSALRQQHALDLSNAYSRIRTLETTVFDAEAEAHALRKQITVLEDQQRSVSRTSHRPFSPPLPSRPASRALKHADDLRRSSFNSHRSNLVPPSSRPTLDDNLSPETRHKRKVSLSMLKARIDSEMAAAQYSSNPSSRAISPVHVPRREFSGLPTVKEPLAEPEFSIGSHHHKRPQFLDEAHIFWCHSCRGDLVIL